MTVHLTEEQFCALLFGEPPSAEAAAHLAACETCRREVGAVTAATANFAELGGTWAHTEAAHHVHSPSRLALRLGFQPRWALGGATAACLLAIGLALSSGHLHRSPSQSGSSPYTPSPVDIAQDNRLCQSIDNTLHSGSDVIVIPLSELRDAGPRQHAHAPVNVVVN